MLYNPALPFTFGSNLVKQSDDGENFIAKNIDGQRAFDSEWLMFTVASGLEVTDGGDGEKPSIMRQNEPQIST